MSLTRAEAEQLLYREAQLLDEARYHEWLEMLTTDVLYRIPQHGAGGDPAHEISIAYDDAARLKDRIGRLATGLAHAQDPRSKTQRLISNIQIVESSDDAAQVRSAMMLYELRRGRERIFAGRCEYRLRRELDGWKIAAKTVILVNNDEVIDNLTFIV
jgi:p-cumate 2,3-dioxygenase subunit beta